MDSEDKKRRSPSPLKYLYQRARRALGIVKSPLFIYMVRQAVRSRHDGRSSCGRALSMFALGYLHVHTCRYPSLLHTCICRQYDDRHTRNASVYRLYYARCIVTVASKWLRPKVRPAHRAPQRSRRAYNTRGIESTGRHLTALEARGSKRGGPF